MIKIWKYGFRLSSLLLVSWYCTLSIYSKKHDGWMTMLETGPVQRIIGFWLHEAFPTPTYNRTILCNLNEDLFDYWNWYKPIEWEM